MKLRRKNGSQKDPEQYSIQWCQIAYILEKHRKDGAARCAYGRVLRKDAGQLYALMGLGSLLYKSRDWEESRVLYQLAIRAHPQCAEACYNLGGVEDDLGNFEASVEAYTQALSVAPDFTSCHFNLALVYEKIRQKEKARPHWETFLRLVNPAKDAKSCKVAREFLEDPSA